MALSFLFLNLSSHVGQQPAGLWLITIVIVIDCNGLHFLCNHNRNRNHTFSKLDVIVIMLCNHL